MAELLLKFFKVKDNTDREKILAVVAEYKLEVKHEDKDNECLTLKVAGEDIEQKAYTLCQKVIDYNPDFQILEEPKTMPKPTIPTTTPIVPSPRILTEEPKEDTSIAYKKLLEYVRNSNVVPKGKPEDEDIFAGAISCRPLGLVYFALSLMLIMAMAMS